MHPRAFFTGENWQVNLVSHRKKKESEHLFSETSQGK